MSYGAPIIVVGAGQAGLAVSHELTARGLDHVVLERDRIASTWRSRWDSFCLVTPNWSVRLPGQWYDGEDPDGYMPRDAIVGYLERYARSFAAPIREGVEVRSLRRDEPGFVLATSAGELRAETVVVTSGTYAMPFRPPASASLPARVQAIDVTDYRSPSGVAAGAVLVIGGGQSGCQIAEELCAAGRDVFLSAGRVPWVPRRIGGRDVVHWHEDTGYFDQSRASLSTPEARLVGNQQLAGGAGGHDLNYRVLRALGVELVGHLAEVSDGRVRFRSDLGESVAFGDARYNELRERVRAFCERRGVESPEMPDPEPFETDARDSLPLNALGAIVFASGFRPGYASWVHVPGAFDASGFPLEDEGASRVAPGLYFCGTHFMRKRKSSLLIGVGEDAAIVADAVARWSR